MHRLRLPLCFFQHMWHHQSQITKKALAPSLWAWGSGGWERSLPLHSGIGAVATAIQSEWHWSGHSRFTVALHGAVATAIQSEWHWNGHYRFTVALERSQPVFFSVGCLGLRSGYNRYMLQLLFMVTIFFYIQIYKYVNISGGPKHKNVRRQSSFKSFSILYT